MALFVLLGGRGPWSRAVDPALPGDPVWHHHVAALARHWRSSGLAGGGARVALVVRLPGAPLSLQIDALERLSAAIDDADARAIFRRVWRVDAALVDAARDGSVPATLFDGLHFSGDARAAQRPRDRPDVPFGVPVHGLSEAKASLACGPDWCFVSPVRPTASKPGAAPITTATLSALRTRLGPRSVALGGVDAAAIEALGAQGWRRFASASAVLEHPAACVASLRRVLGAPPPR